VWSTKNCSLHYSSIKGWLKKDLTLFVSKGCLHRAADLTLVPSVAIAEDFETAKVVSG
jgi:hypothetical protein